ncbi:MAG: hypothetical protein N4A35_07450 [Flavobacteriales bacterium]|jgi:hypothetical protein|nr:hypothetical protein [Flavobacteriales bacterium]
MKNLIKILSLLILTSCAASSDVVHKGFLQKRKYKKGYSLSVRSKTESKHKKVDRLTAEPPLEEVGVFAEKEKVSVEERRSVSEVIPQESVVEESLLALADDDGKVDVGQEGVKKTKLLMFTEKLESKLEHSGVADKKVEKVYKSNYTFLMVLGILSCVMIFGIFILIKIRKIGKEKINSSKELNRRSIVTGVLYLLGLLLLLGIVMVLNAINIDGSNAWIDSLAFLLILGASGILVLIVGLSSLIPLFSTLTKLSKETNE